MAENKSQASQALIIYKPKAEGGETVREPSGHYYRSLSLDELQTAITKMLGNIQGGIARINAEMRHQLLPALEVLRERLPHGQWEQFLVVHKLNPNTVRFWRAQERLTTTALVELLGEEPKKRNKKKREEPDESAAVELAKAGNRLAKAVLKNNKKYAAKLAVEYQQAFNEVFKQLEGRRV